MYMFLTNSRRILLKENVIVKSVESLISARLDGIERNRKQQSDNSVPKF